MATFPAQPASSAAFGVRKSSRVTLRRALCLWHLCSLDAPTVAVIWTAAVAWVAHVHLTASWCVAMACAVWAIYVADRLMDARAGRCNLQLRHAFHWRWRGALVPAAAMAGVTAAWIVLTGISVPGLARDSIVGAAALAYFSGVHAPRRISHWLARIVSRELVVGVVFAAGCALPEFSSVPFAQEPRAFLIALLFLAAVAWMNVRSICWWEESRGGPSAFWACTTVALAGIPLAIGLAATDPRAALLVACAVVSSMQLAALDRVRMDPLLRRAAADLVLLTPVLCVLLAGRVL